MCVGVGDGGKGVRRMGARMMGMPGNIREMHGYDVGGDDVTDDADAGIRGKGGGRMMNFWGVAGGDDYEGGGVDEPIYHPLCLHHLSPRGLVGQHHKQT